MFVFTGCAATQSGPRQSVLAGIAAGLGSLLSNATGSLSYSNGPVEVGITSDGKTISRSYRLRDGKNVIELRRGGAAQ